MLRMHILLHSSNTPRIAHSSKENKLLADRSRRYGRIDIGIQLITGH
ncbi:MAG: hypothetical protein ACOC6B_05080 [Thermodesulfobacteriota bacterium]